MTSVSPLHLSLLLSGLMLLVTYSGPPELTPAFSVAPISEATPRPIHSMPSVTVGWIEQSVVSNMSDGEIVHDVWSGKNTGINCCNRCMCLNCGLAYRTMASLSENRPAKPTPSPTPTQIHTTKPTQSSPIPPRTQVRATQLATVRPQVTVVTVTSAQLLTV